MLLQCLHLSLFSYFFDATLRLIDFEAQEPFEAKLEPLFLILEDFYRIAHFRKKANAVIATY